MLYVMPEGLEVLEELNLLALGQSIEVSGGGIGGGGGEGQNGQYQLGMKKLV